MSEGKFFFSTIPGILTGLAALITAITGLLFALTESSIIDINKNSTSATDNTNDKHSIEQTSTETTTVGWAIIGNYRAGKFSDLKLMVHDKSPAIGKNYDVVDDFRLIQKRLKRGEDQGQTITLGKVTRGQSVEVVDIYIKSPSTVTVPVWAKLRAKLH